jgi:soluble lytic murein transglycosylase-like protein
MEPYKLATEMADFVQQKTVQDKLNWIRSKRAIYVDSPIWPTIQEWENVLQKMAGKTELSKVPGLSAENIDVQARSLIRALGGESAQQAATAAEASAVASARNVARSNVTKLLGAGGVGALLASGLGGVGAAAGGALTAGGLFALEAARAARVGRGTDLVAKSLTEALRDPAIALKYIQDAQQYGATRAAEIATQDAALRNVANAISGAGAPVGAIGRSVFANELPPLPETAGLDEVKAREEELTNLIAQREATPTPAPTETPAVVETPAAESMQVGKQNISIPVGDEFAEPKLVKAVIQQESSGNPNAVSRKGAKGLMQLMPGTAKDMGVSDPFDPQQNVEGGSKYLAKQLEDFGDTRIALAAYNAGPQRIRNIIKKLESEELPVTTRNILRLVPTETKTYVQKVMNYYNA